MVVLSSAIVGFGFVFSSLKVEVTRTKELAWTDCSYTNVISAYTDAIQVVSVCVKRYISIQYNTFVDAPCVTSKSEARDGDD